MFATLCRSFEVVPFAFLYLLGFVGRGVRRGCFAAVMTLGDDVDSKENKSIRDFFKLIRDGYKPTVTLLPLPHTPPRFNTVQSHTEV